MKLPRDLSGTVLAEHLCRQWEYIQVHQVGSHVVLQTQEPTPHRISIPAHASLRIGTLNSILRDIAVHKGVDRETILGRR
jgi:predicted RNA binding protein YcfA (HicA-like mRNA interferase family)